ncbi:hypothetical protein [Rhizobium lusitanum]|nr:hypothetical protein [Rhizobium lusitanum]
MAQDLLWLRPDAVRQTSGGFYQVDYGRLDVRMVSLDEEVSLDGDDNVMQAIARALKSAKSDDRCFALTR